MMTRLTFFFTFLILLTIASLLFAWDVKRARSEDSLGRSGNDSPGVKIISASPQEALYASWVPVSDQLQKEAVNPQQ